MASLLAGNIVQFTVQFTDTDTGDLVDPAVVTFSYTLNGGDATDSLTYAGSAIPAVGVIARLSTGTYVVQIDTTGFAVSLMVGTFVSTGTGAATASDSITVGGPPRVFYTLGNLTDDTFLQLKGSTRTNVNILSEPIDAPAPLTVETIYLTGSVNGVVVGGLIVNLDETMYVLSVTPANYSAQVIRGYEDTTPVAASAGALVVVDPPWTRSVVQARIRDEIRSWAPQVWQPASIEIPIVSQQRGYDLGAITGTIIRVLRITAPQPPYVGSPGYWDLDEVGNGINTNTSLADPTFPFIYNSSADTGEFPSGRSITLTGQTLPTVNGNLHVVYAAPFDVDTSWVESTDMISQVGMDSRDLDIPTLGAACRLLRMLSVRRAMLNVQGQNRDDQDVTMPAILQAAQQFDQATQSRLGDVQQRLYSDYPIRQSNY